MIEVPVDKKLLDRLFHKTEAYIVNDILIHLYLILNKFDKRIMLDINSCLEEEKIIVEGIDKLSEEMIDETLKFLGYILSFE